MFFDGICNLVFHVGTNAILQNTSVASEQKYISVSAEPNASTYQISCLAVSKVGGLLAVSSEKLESDILVWDMSTKICLAQFSVPCSIVYQMVFSDNGEILVLFGLTKHYHSVVMIVDWKAPKVLSTCSFLHEAYWKIKCLCFKNNSATGFITCGTQHLALWEYQADLLHFRNF